MGVGARIHGCFRCSGGVSTKGGGFAGLCCFDICGPDGCRYGGRQKRQKQLGVIGADAGYFLEVLANGIGVGQASAAWVQW